MPELPETETIARDLHREIAGLTVLDVSVRRGDVLRGISAADLGRRTIGARFDRIWRRAKLVVLDLSSGEHLVVQPRFTGALILASGPLPERDASYSTLSFRLNDLRDVHYRDIRRLGTVTLMTASGFERYSAALGIEPLDPGFTDAHLSVLLRASKQALKKVLMDQRMVVGIGNIYANEACWRAGIDPSRVARSVDAEEVRRLRSAIVSVLNESIAARGTSFRDYVDAYGGKGGFEQSLAAYGRGGEPCLNCGARLVETHAIDGRTTVLCARCQK